MTEKVIRTADELVAEADELALAIQEKLQPIPGLVPALERVRPPYNLGKDYPTHKGIIVGKIWPILRFTIDGIPCDLIDSEFTPERGVVFHLQKASRGDRIAAKIRFGAFTRGVSVANPNLIKESVEAALIKFRDHGERIRRDQQLRNLALSSVRAVFGAAFKYELHRITQSGNYIEGVAKHYHTGDEFTWVYLQENKPEDRIRVISAEGPLFVDAREAYLDARRSLETEFVRTIVASCPKV